MAIIPARGGSKGVPKKNIMPFCGKPLIAWTIGQSLAAGVPVYVSSDDPNILDISSQHGAYTIERPAKLSTDTASSDSVLVHAIDEIGDVDVVVFLQCTSPLKTARDISNAVGLYRDVDCVFSVSVLDDVCLWDSSGNPVINPPPRAPRQMREPYYWENGAIHVFSACSFMKTGDRWGAIRQIYKMPSWTMFEIDSPEDVGICEYYFKERILNANHR